MTVPTLNPPKSRAQENCRACLGGAAARVFVSCLFFALSAPLAGQSFSTANASATAQIARQASAGDDWEDEDEEEPEEAPQQRFFPAVWISVDLETRRLRSDLVDPGTLIRFWGFGSTVRGAQNVFGPVVGLRTVGVGWLWHFRDGSFYFGLSGVVETERLFDKTKKLTVRPAVTLSMAGRGR